MQILRESLRSKVLTDGFSSLRARDTVEILFWSSSASEKHFNIKCKEMFSAKWVSSQRTSKAISYL